jgi:hypothetical protein
MSAATRLAALPLAARRSVAVAVLAMVVVLAWSVIVMPLRALLTSQTEWREDMSRRIARDRGTLESASRVREAAAALDSSALRGWLYELGGALPPADALQNDLRSALLASGVEPTNFKVLPATNTNGLRAQRVEFSTILTVDQLQAFFVALDGQPHYVRIERLRLDAPDAQRADENPRMTALMEARGYSVEGPAPELRVARAY